MYNGVENCYWNVCVSSLKYLHDYAIYPPAVTSKQQMKIFNAKTTSRVITLPTIADLFLSFSLQHNGLGSIFTLPPRPKISRSFSFSESEAPRRISTGVSRMKGKSEVREQEIGRAQSVYGLQTPGLSWIDSLGSQPGAPSSPSACPNCSESSVVGV